MAIYERTQRESAHVYSRVVDKSQVPSSVTWAALGCVTASRGELNKVYQVGTTDYLEKVFGEPTQEHISLICASKIIYDNNTMYLIRVAHENSLKGSQVVVSTEKIYENATAGIGVIEEDARIQLKEITTLKDIKNIASDLTFYLDNIEEFITMTNQAVQAGYRDVYQIDNRGNKTFSNELCLLLSDVLDIEQPVVVTKSESGVELGQTDFDSNWFYGDGYAKRSAIVLKSTSGVVENKSCDVTFKMKQTAQRSYGTPTPNKVIVPVVFQKNNVN